MAIMGLEHGNLVFGTRDMFPSCEKKYDIPAMTNGTVSSTIVISRPSCENKRDEWPNRMLVAMERTKLHLVDIVF